MSSVGEVDPFGDESGVDRGEFAAVARHEGRVSSGRDDFGFEVVALLDGFDDAVAESADTDRAAHADTFDRVLPY